MKEGRWVRTGVAITIACAFAILGYYSTILLWEDIRPWGVYKLSFTKTQGLEKNDDVFVFGLRVGRVYAIGFEGDHQLALIQMDPSVTIYRTGVRVDIIRTDAFGTVAIFIDPGDPTSGTWPRDLAIEGQFQEALTAGAADAASPTALGEFIVQAVESTNALLRPDGGTLGRLLNDRDLAEAIKDGFAETARTIATVHDGVARIGSGEGPGGLIAQEPAFAVTDAALAARESMAQIHESLREISRGEGGNLGRLLGDVESRARARDTLASFRDVLEEYRTGEGNLTKLLTHAPEPGERALSLLDSLSSGTERAMRGEGPSGALLGPSSGEDFRQPVRSIAARLDAGRHADASAGDLLSDDPAGQRSLQDSVARIDDVLKDMRRALARIRSAAAANTFQGALFSVF